MTDKPKRGFAREEFEARHEKAKRLMNELQLDALLVTGEQNVRYFTGFASQFWQSPTRPWFVIVPRAGDLIAVIPTIGEAGMNSTWVKDVRCWPSPVPEDDGVTLLSQALKEIPPRFGRIGCEFGQEMVMRMALNDLEKIRNQIGSSQLVDGTTAFRRLRGVKSEAEIEKIHYICQLASTAFETMPERFYLGMTEVDACREMRIEMLRLGADDAPYMMGSSGRGGYDNIIMGPLDRPMNKGDIMIIDTGSTYDGYFCDFDRNYSFGEPTDAAKKAYDVVYQATEAGLAIAGPSVTTTELWRAMNEVMEAGGALGNDVGRLGHGLGAQLTEWPSNKPGDDTLLVAGMVMTLEPGMAFAPGQNMVHEENIIITDNGCELLSRRAWPEMPVIDR